MHEKKKIERILVRVPNWIGDAVISLPALSALKEVFSGAGITVLAKPRVAPVYENNPAVSGIIVYESNGIHAGFAGLVRLSRELKGKCFQIAVLFQNAFEAAFLAFLARVPERVGYARDLRTPLLTRPIPLTGDILKKHQVFYYLNIIKELGGDVPLERPVPRIYVKEGEPYSTDKFIPEKGFTKEGEFFYGVAPGASYGQAKRWKVEGFKEVIGKISKDLGGVPVIFGGGGDCEAAEALSKSLLSVRHINLAGKTTLREFIALCARMRFFITNDSGPMHVAAALGVPTVGIFGSTEPALTGPLGTKATVVRKKVECSPCFKRECPYGHYKCMNGISSEDVYARLQAMLAGVF
ncbi:MAG: lipopolysaccharide heptosyltransferase II [Deltaproteobacteria bacterium]|nr:lipopolysaccharide heptosyltransferase II [Deltaproteobacteria bacterium]